jgi:hypothetical protein
MNDESLLQVLANGIIAIVLTFCFFGLWVWAHNGILPWGEPPDESRIPRFFRYVIFVVVIATVPYFWISL